MPPIVEPLNGGLVTARDASLLQPGELAVAEDVMLLPASPTLHKAFGRSRFNSTALANIDGLAYADFDTALDKVVAVANGSYYTAPAAEAGVFTLLTGNAGASLDSVSLMDKTVLFSGGVHNIVLLNDGTQRRQGLNPVTASVGAQHLSTGGTWPLGATSVPKYYEYWTTEVVKTLLDEVESSFEGTPITVNVTTTASHVSLIAPNTTNPSATHWRIYRSNGKSNSTDVAFPLGFLIADVPIGTRSFEDGIVQTVALTLPTVAESPTIDIIPSQFPSSYVNKVKAWLTPNNALLDDAALATTPVLARSGSNPQTVDISWLLLRTFNFPVVGSPITNIQLQVEGSKTSDCYLMAGLSWDAGVTFTQFITIPFTTSNSTVVIDSLWPPFGSVIGRVWSGEDFTNINFRVLFFASGAPGAAATASIDFVKIAITHSGTTASQTTPFPSLQLTVGGRLISISANGLPPRATTADLFQGSILMNDIENPTNIAWTIPGTLDSSPILYRMAMDDKVNCIRSLGSSAVIGGRDSCTRMNYLPVAEDPEFNTGRAIDVFDSDDGIVSGKGAVRFVLGSYLMLFYVGQTSLKMTNAFSTQTATDDIIWTNLVNLSAITKCFVENNSRNHEILVYYPAAGSTAVNKILRLSYDSTHLKDGKLKVVGITNYAADAATSGTPLSERLIFTTVGGTVYVENRGLSDASGGSILPKISTREMHQNGIGNSWELQRFGIHHQQGGIIKTSTTSSLANYPVETTSDQQHSLDTRTTSIIDNAAAGDGITINITGTDDGLPMELDYLVLYPSDLNESSPLKR